MGRQHSGVAARKADLLPGVECDNLDLDVHVLAPEARDADARPQRLVVGTPLPQALDHCGKCGIVQRDMVGVDAEDLRPALSSCGAQGQVDILERLCDLLFNVGGDLVVRGVPAACGLSVVTLSGKMKGQ